MVLVSIEQAININHHATVRNEDVGKRNLSSVSASFTILGTCLEGS